MDLDYIKIETDGYTSEDRPGSAVLITGLTLDQVELLRTFVCAEIHPLFNDQVQNTFGLWV